MIIQLDKIDEKLLSSNLMKKFILILILSFFFIPLLSAENILEIDAGTIDNVSLLPVTLSNSSSGSLEFSVFSESVHLIPLKDKIELNPGEEAEIVIEIDPGEYKGDFENSILIYSGNKVHSRIKIRAFIDTEKNTDNYILLLLAFAPVIILFILIIVWFIRKNKVSTE